MMDVEHNNDNNNNDKNDKIVRHAHYWRIETLPMNNDKYPLLFSTLITLVKKMQNVINNPSIFVMYNADLIRVYDMTHPNSYVFSWYKHRRVASSYTLDEDGNDVNYALELHGICRTNKQAHNIMVTCILHAISIIYGSTTVKIASDGDFVHDEEWQKARFIFSLVC